MAQTILNGNQLPVSATDLVHLPGTFGRGAAIVSKTLLKTIPQLAPAREPGTVSIASVLEELSRSVRPCGLVLFQESSCCKTHSAAGSIGSYSVDHSDQHKHKQQHCGLYEIRLKHQKGEIRWTGNSVPGTEFHQKLALDGAEVPSPLLNVTETEPMALMFP